ncbi:hypothetical protein LOTGIDRAFT_173452 [Lottia gigantea]|uniref:G-protein coupled receptors family 1 profile domain-containing protein n=1 Tax=Lottia gigantea TaxID=225164 RepID=V4AS98_LOTGI|nr:hypothetical protein LOTGIDRAFT_173452 [Lottia gigantea]ESP00148.1 hypothetical protein LOTGIDRAFT_173452 [Lottia gigantea]
MGNETKIIDLDIYNGALSDTSHTLLGVYMTFVGLLSCSGNGLIIYVFIRNRLFRQPPINVFIISLASGNLLESSLGFPLCAASNFARRWLFGSVLCNFYGFTCYSATLANMSTFVVISLYRYIVICRPERVSHMLTNSNIRKAICGVWMYALFWATLPLVGWGGYNLEPYKTSCSLDWTNTSINSKTYIICVSLFVLMIPLMIMIIAYSAIICQTKTHISSLTSSGEVNNLPIDHAQHGVQVVSDIENRISKIVSVTIILYVISWMPYAIFSLMSTWGVIFDPNFTVIPIMLAKTQCAYTPLIYIIGHKKFRRTIFALVGVSSASNHVASQGQFNRKKPAERIQLG